MARFVHVTFTLRCTALTLLLSVLMATYRQMHHLWVLLTPVNETTPCVTFTTTNQVFFTCSSSRPFDPFVQRLDRRDSTAKLIENCVNSSYRPLRVFFSKKTTQFVLPWEPNEVWDMKLHSINDELSNLVNIRRLEVKTAQYLISHCLSVKLVVVKSFYFVRNDFLDY